MFARAVRSTNTWYTIRLKNENIASMRLPEVVAPLINKNLIAQIHVGAHDRFSLPILLTELRPHILIRRKYPKLISQYFRRHPNRISSSGGHPDQGPVPYQLQLNRRDIRNAILVLLRNDVGIRAPQRHQLKSLHQDIWAPSVYLLLDN